ncbi:hypothetical protein B4125_0326 [Bacillus paralicheniformis]|nr:hypothetical protein SC10_B2orf04797 [Bacillus paralicheniformis]OLG08750.1 hypothetical protein B4125_0326 [Bacillus paralicheniformis]TWJ49575.1 hypothetical protein CHCC5023_1758 [Bacillus paralicheniformis]TWJ65986.1 hypothetical protein CHCC5021_0262 [Bacillus paralicheniformis]TWK49427.1 hypothetical protein CHCC20347_1710 [Bacillus paralicheniformis]
MTKVQRLLYFKNQRSQTFIFNFQLQVDMITYTVMKKNVHF